MSHHIAHIGPENAILHSLPAFQAGEFRAELEHVDLPLGEVLIEAGAAIPFVYFPNQGVASVLIVLANGGSVEVGMIDRYGLVGARPWFDPTQSHHQVVVQAAVQGYRIKTSLFNGHAEGAGMGSPAMVDFSYLYPLQIAQTAACNRLHAADRRLARWLLMMDDRMTGAMEMTQEFLGFMLGTRRSTVNYAANVLQEKKTIALSRNRILIINRAQLELSACECYVGLREIDLKRGIIRVPLTSPNRN
ncbi:cyclic nucleotide-binding protein [Candidatus Koribacter versatilis Ellin345]|uniref:Cyclic nucleotide-binding protein n=1 Tax=Koribacter versatilis (strain Ellin345) TaxID=204669 RepID=Q1IN46_KORVE|nr:Crp/Fnr family transcriptional regulator [Candidatus Koribacter versatilis]ABF41704.1 cyclic nucleotide-binding protein [Candidatus Koribacter versatilis Ellin345]